jgi:hypothetical protein
LVHPIQKNVQKKRERQRVEIKTLVNRARNEFLEMPGLQLTPQQAARLWGLDATKCQSVIDALVEAEFLRWTSTGRLVRTDHWDSPDLPPAWRVA